MVGQKVLDDLRNLYSDLPESEIARIRRGDYTSDEAQRIERAKRLLRENGFEKEAKLLDNKENADKLLFSHYSGNRPDSINIFSKARPLLQKGFSKDAVRVLGDNWVIGNSKLTSSIKDNPALIKLAEDATKNQQIQKELNHLLEELNKGNLQAGLGKPGHIEGTSIFYLRGERGGRLYYRKTSEGYDIVGKSTKGKNQDQVMNKLREIYSN